MRHVRLTGISSATTKAKLRSRHRWLALSIIGLAIAFTAPGCNADVSGVGATPSFDSHGNLRQEGTPPAPCYMVPCPPPPTPAPAPPASTWLPTCYADITSAYQNYQAYHQDVVAALGNSEGTITAYYTVLGIKTCYWGFANGSIEWSAASGAHEVQGAIYAKWASLGFEDAPVGMPTTDEGAAVNGRFNHFTNGSIYWDQHNAWEVLKPIEDKWAYLGWERGILGLPNTDTTVTPNGLGAYNHFQNNGSIYTTSSSVTTAFEVHGAIRTRWMTDRQEAGFLGFPTSDEIEGQHPCLSPGCGGSGSVSHFQNGSIFWAPSGISAIDAHAVPAEFAASVPSACIGYPIAEPVTSGTSQSQRFEADSLSYTIGVPGSLVGGSCCGYNGACCNNGSGNFCQPNLRCHDNGLCFPSVVPCGGGGEECCNGTTCDTGFTCQGGSCEPPPHTSPCGGANEACCNNNAPCNNNASLACDTGDHICKSCGYIPGNLCCTSGLPCPGAGLTCVTNPLGGMPVCQD